MSFCKVQDDLSIEKVGWRTARYCSLVSKISQRSGFVSKWFLMGSKLGYLNANAKLFGKSSEMSSTLKKMSCWMLLTIICTMTWIYENPNRVCSLTLISVQKIIMFIAILSFGFWVLPPVIFIFSEPDNYIFILDHLLVWGSLLALETKLIQYNMSVWGSKPLVSYCSVWDHIL